MNIYPMRAVRNKRWKYIRNLHPKFAFSSHMDLVYGTFSLRRFFSAWEMAAKTDPDTVVILKRYHARPSEELYHLASDPY